MTHDIIDLLENRAKLADFVWRRERCRLIIGRLVPVRVRMVGIAVVRLGMSACRHLSTASAIGDLLRISREIQTAPREAERTRRACGI